MSFTHDNDPGIPIRVRWGTGEWTVCSRKYTHRAQAVRTDTWRSRDGDQWIGICASCVRSGLIDKGLVLLHDIPDELCFAGRIAFLGGAWKDECPNVTIHLIKAPGIDPVRLCDDHFNEANAAGMVTEPFIDPAEYASRVEAERLHKERLREYGPGPFGIGYGPRHPLDMD